MVQHVAMAVKPLAMHEFGRRGGARIYAWLAALELPYVGRGATISPQARFLGTRQVYVGARTNVSGYGRFETRGDGRIYLGERSWIGPCCVLDSSVRLVVGDGVLMAGNCFISTDQYAFDGTGPIRDQGRSKSEPVYIGAGAWLGANVVVTPGVTIGEGAVIGANAVVNRNVPARSLAAGVPACTTRRF